MHHLPEDKRANRRRWQVQQQLEMDNRALLREERGRDGEQEEQRASSI